MYVKENGVWRVNDIGRDYLGSITYITDEDSKLKQELSYDAWGRLRNPDNRTVYTLSEEPEPVLGGRYTGHEHLPMFGPVNMNARLYDPVVGLFLSPDPYVQAPWMTQNFNRYSYALNNPLRYTDESGESWLHAIGAVVGGTINVISNWNNIQSFWHGVSLFAVGSASGFFAVSCPGMVTPIAAATSALNSIVNQGFTNGPKNINYQQVVYEGIVGGVTSAVGYGLSPVAMFSYSVAGAVKYSAYSAANMILSNIIPPIPIGNTGFSISPSAMLTAGVGNAIGLSGFNLGAGISYSRNIGDWGISVGLSISEGKGINNLYGGLSYDDGKVGFSYYYTKYMHYGKQNTGTIGFKAGDFSFKWDVIPLIHFINYVKYSHIKKIMKYIFIVIIVLLLTGCTVIQSFTLQFRPKNLDFRFDNQNTGLDTVIYINGYYSIKELPYNLSTKSVMFYNNGLACIARGHSHEDAFIHQKESLSLLWGGYILKEDTIIVQIIEIPDPMAETACKVTNNIYKILSKNKIVYLPDRAISYENIEKNDEYVNYFHPLPNRIDSTNWLLKKKWFWKEE